jgi:hypothetical protein
MTKDEILEMAKKIGVIKSPFPQDFPYGFSEIELVNFAKLVAEKERNECDAVCKNSYEWAEAKLNESTREENIAHWAGRMRAAQDIGKAIRARGQE